MWPTGVLKAEKVDIVKLNVEIEQIVAPRAGLAEEIDKIIAEIEEGI